MCPSMQVSFGSILPQLQVHVTLYVFITAVVAAGVGSAVVVLLLAIIIVLTVTAVVTSCKKKGERHFWII